MPVIFDLRVQHARRYRASASTASPPVPAFSDPESGTNKRNGAVPRRYPATARAVKYGVQHSV